ncbi:lipocalin family protein [Comamonas testosteroni]|uniref:lipocalin family protein n=1 Tax=Comamonas testosteroni TaxID=285 RepID=UPI0015F844FD|nr:lipocalin family protein [Comamonas testosteroni]WEE80401.1 lipocalin family protein [Comamonas testosteroni]WEE80501.1 lipocalin family protein [Comamonas testosteroni]
MQPVTGFDAKRYMGTWYELARIEHSFEKGLTQVSAQYSLNDDGTVAVVNRGYDASKKEWRQANGKARFLGDPSIAALKVSFFGPFYGGYNVVSLDDQYQTSLVIGNSLDYFWLLSRSKSIPEQQFRRLLEKAQSLGVDLSQVQVVPQ